MEIKEKYYKRIKALADQAGKGLVALVFPHSCHLCGALLDSGDDARLCQNCMQQLAFIQSPLCAQCGMPYNTLYRATDHCCSHCIVSPPSFDSARSLLRYRAPVPELLHRLKYHAESPSIGAIEYLIKQKHPITLPEAPDLIIPVPLHKHRLKKRGFNQSLLLARLAFPDYRRKIALNLLLRVKNTTSQTGLSGVKRRRNVKNGFQVRNRQALAGKTICLVDDVYTTGATVSECSKILKNNGASTVHVWTLARV